MEKSVNVSNITQKWVKILLPFTDNYSARMTASELARKTGLPQQSVSRQMDKLVGLNLISYKWEGRNKQFYFELKNQKTRNLISLLETHKALIFCIKVREAFVVVEELLKHCSTIIVFGSYASGKFDSSSDLDIVILGDYNKEKIKKVKNNQAIEVNEHYATYAEFKKLLLSDNPLAIEISSNHILLGDISRMVDIFIEASK